MDKEKDIEAWRRRVSAMNARSASVDWSKIDISKIKASDIGFSLGPMMTEEEFREYRKSRPSVRVVGKKTLNASHERIDAEIDDSNGGGDRGDDRAS